MLNATTSCGGRFQNPLIFCHIFYPSVPAVTHMALCRQNIIRPHFNAIISCLFCISHCVSHVSQVCLITFATHTVISFWLTLSPEIQLLHDSARAHSYYYVSLSPHSSVSYHPREVTFFKGTSTLSLEDSSPQASRTLTHIIGIITTCFIRFI